MLSRCPGEWLSDITFYLRVNQSVPLSLSLSLPPSLHTDSKSVAQSDSVSAWLPTWLCLPSTHSRTLTSPHLTSVIRTRTNQLAVIRQEAVCWLLSPPAEIVNLCKSRSFEVRPCLLWHSQYIVVSVGGMATRPGSGQCLLDCPEDGEPLATRRDSERRETEQTMDSLNLGERD